MGLFATCFIYLFYIICNFFYQVANKKGVHGPLCFYEWWQTTWNKWDRIDVLQFSQDKSEYEKNIENFLEIFLQISKLDILQFFAHFVTESNCLPLVLVKSKWILLTFLHVLLQRLCLPLLSQTTLKMKKIHHIRNRRPANSKKRHYWTSCKDWRFSESCYTTT